MATAPISSIVSHAEQYIVHGTSTVTSLASKWFAKKDVKEEVVVDTHRLRTRRNSILQTYSPAEMKKNVESYGNGLDTVRFKLALDKFENAQSDFNSAESEDSLSARRISLTNAHDTLTAEYKRLKIHQEKEKRLSEAKEKELKQTLPFKVLKVKEFLGNCTEMSNLEQIMETEPELANVLLDARIAIINNKFKQIC